MFNNKIDTYQSINNNIAKQINNALKRLPKSQVCKVEEVNDDYAPFIMNEELLKFIVRVILNDESYITFKKDE